MNDRKRREEEETRRKQEKQVHEEMKRRESERRIRDDGFPDMDPSERLEAEMSMLPLDEESMEMLRRLRPQEAIDMLQKAPDVGGAPGSLAAFVHMKARSMLLSPGVAASVAPSAAPAAPMQGVAPATFYPTAAFHFADAGAAHGAKRPGYDVGGPVDADGSYMDFPDDDFIPEDNEPLPQIPPAAPTDEPPPDVAEAIASIKEAAQRAEENGDLARAVSDCTEAMRLGGSTALLLTRRAGLLLRQSRPLAAIADSQAALAINPDSGKAFRIRGLAYRMQGRLREAYDDIVHGQQLDFDESIVAVQRLVAERLRVDSTTARKRART